MHSRLVQLNVSRLRAPLDDDSTRGFRDGLAPVNAAGDAAHGFVSWWVPAGALPTIDEGRCRLAFIDEYGDSPYAWRSLGSPTTTQQRELVVVEHALAAIESQGLIDELNADLVASSGPDEQMFFSLGAEEIAAGSGQFLVAWLDGQAVGCGAFRMLGNGTAEMKRMYVQPAVRGHRIGAAVLHELEARAIAAGATRLVLETGHRLSGALALYSRAGFTRCTCWGEYADSVHSLCLEKPVIKR